MIRKILTISIFLVYTFSFSKPYQGKYILTGKVYDKTTIQLLSNQVILINDLPVMTDTNGIYKVEIEWKTADSFYFKNREEQLIANKKFNKECITITYSSKKLLIKNKWKKYGLRMVNKSIKQDYIVNLFF